MWRIWQSKWLAFRKRLSKHVRQRAQEYLTSGKRIPQKTVLLTFDDGYESNYVYAFPILKKYKMKANFSVVVRDSQRRQVKPDGTPYQPDSLRHMTFDEMREMVASGLVEIGSHSFDSHGAVNVDHTGKTAPALINLRYYTKTGHLETKEEYTRRVADDLKLSQTVLYRNWAGEPAILPIPTGALRKILKTFRMSVFKRPYRKTGPGDIKRTRFGLGPAICNDDMTLTEYAKLVKWL